MIKSFWKKKTKLYLSLLIFTSTIFGTRALLLSELIEHLGPSSSHVVAAAALAPYGSTDATSSIFEKAKGRVLEIADPHDLGTHVVLLPSATGEGEIALCSTRGCRLDPIGLAKDAYWNVRASAVPLKESFDLPGKGHAGYVARAQTAWDQINEALPDTVVGIAAIGHSMGGATMLLAGKLSLESGMPTSIITMGAPPVMCDEAAAALSEKFEGALLRVASDKDPVPRLPEHLLFGYLFRGFTHPFGLELPVYTAPDATQMMAHSLELLSAALHKASDRFFKAMTDVAKDTLRASVSRTAKL